MSFKKSFYPLNLNLETLMIVKLFSPVSISSTGIIIGPLNHVWYSFLDKKFPMKTFNAICKKVLLDQLIGATFFTFLFIVITCLLDGFSIKEALKEFVDKFPFIYLVSWLF
jgi:hypothetical protein